MVFDYSLIIAIGGVLVLGLGTFLANSARYLTLREHEANLKAVSLLDAAMDVRLKDMLERIKVLEQTRPTTGELRAYVTRQLNGTSEHHS